MPTQVISFKCVLKNKMGQTISSTYNRDVLNGEATKSKKLNDLALALVGIQKGEKREVSLRADQAYGYYDPQLVVKKSLDEIELSAPIELGEQVIYIKDGKRKSYRVSELSDRHVVLDGNHPLAGQDLVFEIEALEAREATAEDCA